MNATYVEAFHSYPGAGSGRSFVPMPALSFHGTDSGFYTQIQQSSTLSPSDPRGDVDERFLHVNSGTFLAQINGASIARAPDFQDGYAAASLRLQGSSGLCARMDSAMANGYIVTFVDGATDITINLYKIVATVGTLIGSATKARASFAESAGPIGNAMLFLNGTSIKVKIWPLDTAQPDELTWDLSVTDASIVAAGWFGVGGYLGGLASGNMSVYAGYISVSEGISNLPYIPKTYSQRRAMLEESYNVSVALFEAELGGTYDDSSVESAYVLMSNYGFVTQEGDLPSNSCYEDVVESFGEFTQTMNDDNLGRATQSFGDVTVSNPDGVRDDWLRWNWDGRDFRIYVGFRGWRKCDFELAARGTIDRVLPSSSSNLVFKLRDASNLLANKLNRSAIGGTGPNANMLEPLLLGKVFNASPVLVDATTHTYQIGQAYSSPLTVRENGADITASADFSLFSVGQFTLTAAPAGAITCDAEYTSAIAYESLNNFRGNNHDGLFKLIATQYSSLSRDQVSLLGSLDNLATTGLFIPAEEDPQVDEVLDRIARSAGGFLFWNRWGELQAGTLDLTEAYGAAHESNILDIEEDDMVNRGFRPVRMLIPSLPWRFLVTKNYTVQDAASLAGSVSEDDRAIYSSAGSIIETAEAGSGLDLASNHRLASRRDDEETLFYSTTKSESWIGTLTAAKVANYAKTVGIFEFSTRRHFTDMEIGSAVDLTHSRYGFQNGVRGIVVKTSKNWRSRRVTAQVAIQLSGLWPVVTAAYPYVSEDYFA